MQLQSENQKKEPLLNNLLKLFMFAMVLANIAGNMYGSLLPLYLKDLNASVVQVGLFFTLSRIIPLALQILGGWISDSLGRLKSIAIGSSAGVLSYVGLLLSPTWQWVLLAEGLGAVTRSLVGPSFGAFIAEQSNEENRAKVYGVTETIFMLTVVIGPPLGGWLADLYGFKFMILMAGILYTVATLIRIAMARISTNGNNTNRENLNFAGLKKNMGLLFGMIMAGGLLTWVLITDGVRDIAFSMSFTFMPLYLEEFGGLNFRQIGLLEAFFGIANMATNIPAGWLADKKGERIAIIGGFVMIFGALRIFLLANAFAGFALAWAVFGVGVGLMSPAYQSLISKAVPDHLRGTAFGFLQSSLGLFSLPAPAIGGKLWDLLGARFLFSLTGWVTLASALPIWSKFKLPDKTTDPETGVEENIALD